MIYLISVGEYSDYYVSALMSAPEGDPGPDVRWSEFRAQYGVPSREEYRDLGHGYFSKKFVDDRKLAGQRAAADLAMEEEQWARISNFFEEWLVTRCGYTCIEYDEFRMPD